MTRSKKRELFIKIAKLQKKSGKPYFIVNKKYSEHFMNDSSRIFILYGSRGSAKTHSIVQKILTLAERPEYFRALILRKKFNTHRTTCWPMFLDILQESNRQALYKINKSEFCITHKKTGNSIYFKGLDDPEKIKGFANPTFAWFEEPNTDGITLKDFNTVQTSMRGSGDLYKQTVLSFNSDDAESWIKKRFFPEGLAFEHQLPENPLVKSPLANVKILHSTYNDNAFIDEDSISAYEGLAEYDPELHRVYAKGLFGGKVKGKVFENYETVDNYDSIKGYVCYAVDWGFNDPTVVIECKLHDGRLYFKEIFYKSKASVENDLVPFLRDNIKHKNAIFHCDSANPSDIRRLLMGGFNAKKAKKAIREGISRLKAYPKFYIDSSSVNTIKELNYYKFQYNSKNDIFLDEPVDMFNHSIDCLRYIVNTDPYIKQDLDRQGFGLLLRKG